MGIWNLFIGPQPEHQHARTMLPPASRNLPGYSETWGDLALQGPSSDDPPDTWRSEEWSGIYDRTPTEVTCANHNAEASELPRHPDTEPDAILSLRSKG